MTDPIFDPQRLKRFLLENGYSEDDVEKNFPTYLENFFSGLITHLLGQFEQADRDQIVTGLNLDTPEGCLEVVKRLNLKLKNASDLKKYALSKEQLLSFIIGF